MKRETMHCTLNFFGEVDDARLEELKEMVAALPNAHIAVKATRVDAFGHRGKHTSSCRSRPARSVLTRRWARSAYRPHARASEQPEDVRAVVESTSVSLEGSVVARACWASTGRPIRRSRARYMKG